MKTEFKFAKGMFDNNGKAEINLGNGLFAIGSVDYDECAELPWQFCDGHGVIEEYRQPRRSFSKRPGQVILSDNFVYDVTATMKRAEKEGWGLSKEESEGLTKKQIIAETIKRDIKYLKGFLNGDWHYVYVKVVIQDSHGEEITSDGIGMVESLGDYMYESLNECLDSCMYVLESELAKRVQEKMDSLNKSVKLVSSLLKAS